MIVPVRAVVVVLGATLKVMIALPVPLVLPLRVIQLTLLYEFHAHPAPVVTVTEPVSPSAAADCEVGLRAYEHETAAAWSIVNVWPATVIVPVRGLVALLPETLNVTVPPPEPLAPAVTTIQFALLDAVQAHPPDVVTVTEPVPPSDGTD